MGCDVKPNGASTPERDFNPRTHMGCDQKTFDSYVKSLISIHAPTWGATHTIDKVLKTCVISIHAPTWGATFNI